MFSSHNTLISFYSLPVCNVSEEKLDVVAQSCLTLCDPMGCSPPCSPIHGVPQVRILEWAVISYSRVLFSFLKHFFHLDFKASYSPGFPPISLSILFILLDQFFILSTNPLNVKVKLGLILIICTHFLKHFVWCHGFKESLYIIFDLSLEIQILFFFFLNPDSFILPSLIIFI